MPKKSTMIRALQDLFLVIKTRKGDEKAYAVIYDRYFDSIYKYIFFRVQSVEIAEDISADVFFKVWQYITQGTHIKNLRALLYKTARNMVIDYYRKKKDIPFDDKKLESTLAHQTSALHSLEGEESKAQLRLALNSLKKEYKEAVELRYIQELSYDEIASIMDKTSGAVRVLVHRGLQDLKKLL